jgi:plasmid stabilization system protein ParE
MKAVYTPASLIDLAEIADWLAVHYPSLAPAVELRIRQVVSMLERWPHSAPEMPVRPGVRVAAVGKYPYRIFYRVSDDLIEILHIHHAARRPWGDP